jgi:hypothetical protein
MSELAVGSIAGLASNGFVVDVASGSQLTQPGMILQVVSTTKTDAFSSTSTSFVDVTGLSLAITPSSVSSKIYILLSAIGGHSSGGTVQFQLVRDATPISIATSGSNPGSSTLLVSDANQYETASTSYLDSPSTISAVTYKVQTMTNTGTMYVNRRGVNGDRAAVSTLTLMEVAG